MKKLLHFLKLTNKSTSLVRFSSASTRHILKPSYDPVPVPSVSIASFILEKSDSFGSREAIVEGETGKVFTYHQVCARVAECVAGLQAAGCKKGDIIGIFANNNPNYLVTFLAANALGAIVTTINPVYTSYELQHVLELTRPTVIFADANLVETVQVTEAELIKKYKHDWKNIAYYSFQDGPGGGRKFSELLQRGKSKLKSMTSSSTFLSNILQNDCDPDSLAVLPFSSGTTGLSKGVMLSHRNINTNLLQMNHKYALPLVPDDVLLAFLPFFHIYGLAIIMLAAARQGAKLVTMSRFDGAKYLQNVQDYRPTKLHLVPPVVLYLARHPDAEKIDFGSVEHLVCGAAPMSLELKQECLDKIKVSKFVEGYGMTEVVVTLMSNQFLDPIGHGMYMLPNLKTKVVDNENESLPANELGELCFQGPNVMKGYYKNPEGTDGCIDKDGWMHSGDIGYYDEEKRFFIVDRKKELIKYKAFQVAPAELEHLLLTHEGVADAAVIGIPDEKAGELAKAFIVKKSDDVTEKELKAFVAARLSSYKHLHGGITFIDKIPKSPSGKILRKDLRK